jgi:hypothetical protein
VSERLGHSGIAITMKTYSHILPGYAGGGRASSRPRTHPGTEVQIGNAAVLIVGARQQSVSNNPCHPRCCSTSPNEPKT